MLGCSADTKAVTLTTAAADAAYEHARLSMVALSGTEGAEPDAELNDLALAAAALCGTSMAMVNVVGERFLTMKGVFGLEPVRLPRTQAVCPEVLAQGAEVLEIPDLTCDSRFTSNLHVSAGHVRFYAAAPLVTDDGFTLGTLAVVDAAPSRLSAAQRSGLEALARVATALLQRQRLTDVLAEVTDRLGREAETDPLTGLRNRRGLQPILDIAPAQSSVALIDLDLFKKLNDTYGHDRGDEALQAFARHLMAECRDRDIPGRWGGEEFLLVLKGAALADAVAAVERIRLLWAHIGPVTMSAGVAEIRPGEGPRAAVDRADVALYEAKRLGRNRVVAAVS